MQNSVSFFGSNTFQEYVDLQENLREAGHPTCFYFADSMTVHCSQVKADNPNFRDEAARTIEAYERMKEKPSFLGWKWHHPATREMLTVDQLRWFESLDITPQFPAYNWTAIRKAKKAKLEEKACKSFVQKVTQGGLF